MSRRLGCIAVVLTVLPAVWVAGQDWPQPGNDNGGSKHSPLRQINRANISRLRMAWKFDTGDVSDGTKLPSRSTFEATPLAIDGVLYVSTAFGRVIALDGETGKQLWAFDPQIDKSIRRNLFVSRGVSSWTDGSERRIIHGDIQGRLWALDAKTGALASSFGDGGKVDLRAGMADGFPDAQYGMTSPAAVCGDVIVTGALVSDGAPRGPSGDIRGFDVRTGKQLWRFHSVPRDGEPGAETWEPGSRENRGGTNAWSLLSVDDARKLVFVPLTSPSYDIYAGDRKGANLYGNSVVALECGTGKLRWHYQTVHHDIWDYDLPAQPALVTVRRDGKDVAAVAQVTKMGYLFVLDRETGKPLFPVEERPFPQESLPGEQPWKTQPVPVKPKPFARQSMSRSELTTVTPESRKECEELTAEARLDVGMYTPLGEQLQVLFPGLNGGANWGGAAIDGAAGVLYVNSMDVGGLFRMIRRGPDAAIPYALRAKKYEFFWDSNGYPCQQPPWGTLNAIDLNTGEYRWQVRLGEFEALKQRGVPKTGTPNIGGPIVTDGGLVFIAATNDRKFRAFDKDTGDEVWSADLPASGFATPMTYRGNRSGRQFVVVAAGGGNKYDTKFSGEIVAFAIDGSYEGSSPSSAVKSDSYQGKPEVLPQKVAPQPIAFSHRIHVERAKVKCLDCHTGAVSADRAGIPSIKVCRACHASMSRSSGEPKWVRVYRVPDFVFFSHKEHARPGIACEQCHGPVGTRDMLLKEVSTNMNSCMSCHRERKAPAGCALCHQLGH